MEGCTRVVGHMHWRETDSTKPSSPTGDETQQHINRLMGISNEVFLKHQPSAPEGGAHLSSGDQQKHINQLLGIDEAVFLKYQPSAPEGDAHLSSAEAQRQVNKLLGIDEETFLKFSNK